MSEPKLPSFYLYLSQVRESGLLSEARLSEIDAEIARRLTTPFDGNGRPILTARLADLSPYGSWLYPRMDHEPAGNEEWAYAKRQILAAILTDAERELLSKHASSAFSNRQEERQFEAAKKVPESEWGGGVFYGDDFYDSTDDLHERLASDEVELEDYPAFCWAAEPHRVIPDLEAEDLLSHIVEDRGWDEMSVDELEGVGELDAAIAKFVDQNRLIVSFRPDYKTAVVLEKHEDPTDIWMSNL